MKIKNDLEMIHKQMNEIIDKQRSINMEHKQMKEMIQIKIKKFINK